MSKAKISETALADAIGEWTTFDGPLFRRLAAAITEAIARGDLPSQRFLPSDRTLARHLAVYRGTVIAAYDLLRDGGWVERRQGSGTRITVDTPRPVVDIHDHAAGLRARRLTARKIDRRHGLIDLGVSILPDSSQLDDSALALDRTTLHRLGRDHGYQPLGSSALRRRIAELHTAAGLPTTVDQVAITLGGQHAIALTARLLIRPGDNVLVESPTYPGAIDAYSRAGAHLISVDTDGAGARVDAIEREAERSPARLSYVMPSCHNPKGSVMPEGRRRALAALSDAQQLWVVEDNSLEQLVLDGPAPAPIAAHATGGHVITIGSLSKVLWGGLRVGWLRADRTVIDRMGRLRAALDFGNCTVSQAIALRALDDHDAVVERLRATYRHRSALCAQLLAERLPDWTFDMPAGGLSIWVRLPHGTADDFAIFAARHRVAILPGGAASADEGHLSHLRLSYGLDETHLDIAIGRLADAWAEFASKRPSATVAG